ncbi:hypothetical protein HK103_004158, partial [Boothiomyces macroporosus]
MDENRAELKLAQQKLEAVEQKLEVLKQRKLELKQKQKKQELSSDEQVELEELLEEIADLKQKEGKWMDIIEITIKKGKERKEEKYYEFRGKVVG